MPGTTLGFRVNVIYLEHHSLIGGASAVATPEAIALQDVEAKRKGWLRGLSIAPVGFLPRTVGSDATRSRAILSGVVPLELDSAPEAVPSLGVSVVEDEPAFIRTTLLVSGEPVFIRVTLGWLAADRAGPHLFSGLRRLFKAFQAAIVPVWDRLATIHALRHRHTVTVCNTTCN